MYYATVELCSPIQANLGIRFLLGAHLTMLYVVVVFASNISGTLNYGRCG